MTETERPDDTLTPAEMRDAGVELLHQVLTHAFGPPYPEEGCDTLPLPRMAWAAFDVLVEVTDIALIDEGEEVTEVADIEPGVESGG